MAQQGINFLLRNIVKDDTIKAIGAATGTNPSQTKTAVKTALPEFITALSKNCETKSGAQALTTALDDHNGSLLGNLFGTIKNKETQTDGEKILGHVFGGGESDIITNIASKAGISQAQAGGVLQTVAPLVMETLGKTKLAQGLDSNGITSVLSDLINGGSLLGFLDQNKDGDIKDDIFGWIINWIKSLFIKQ